MTPNLRIALSIINTSTPREIDAEGLLKALLDPAAPGQAYVRLLLEEVPHQILAGLVADGFTQWRDLEAAAKRWGPGRGETAAYIRDMARLTVG